METKQAYRVRVTTDADADYHPGFWIVETQSPRGGWIVQGVHMTRRDAEIDAQTWQD